MRSAAGVGAGVGTAAAAAAELSTLPLPRSSRGGGAAAGISRGDGTDGASWEEEPHPDADELPVVEDMAREVFCRRDSGIAAASGAGYGIAMDDGRWAQGVLMGMSGRAGQGKGKVSVLATI
jgi:hypothetical protein